jgi:hypothetical protein
MVPPPPELLPQVESKIMDAVKAIPAGRNNALVWVATEKGVNMAIVSRHSTEKADFAIEGYIGKTWSQPIAAGVVGSVAW